MQIFLISSYDFGADIFGVKYGINQNTSKYSYKYVYDTGDMCFDPVSCFNQLSCMYSKHQTIDMFVLDIFTNFSCNATQDNSSFPFAPAVYLIGLNFHYEIIYNILPEYCNTSVSCINKICNMKKENPQLVLNSIIPISKNFKVKC